MCRTCGRRHNSFVQDGSPAQLQDVNSLDSSGNGSIPFSFGLRSPGKVSPLRGRTMKEYEEQMGNLKKENFSLKLRIYFLEEKMGQKYDKEDKEKLYKTNIELKVEAEALKRELCEKQDLVRQASTALNGLEQQYQEKVAQLKIIHEQEKDDLQETIERLQKEVNEYAGHVQEEGQPIGELTKLCGLAFNTGAEEENNLSLGSSQDTLSLPLQVSKPNNGFASPSPMQGLFSMPTSRSASAHAKMYSLSNPEYGKNSIDSEAQHKVASLEAKVAELEERVNELEDELAAKEEANNTLKDDLANLNRELVEKLEKIGELEAEVSEKDMKIDDIMQELETRYMEIKAKDDEIENLTQGLIKNEPEIEVKVQEIVERDRIIEEKIEQIEQQNKILVEIQITLDEKQKQIADMEQKISESSERIKKLTEEEEKYYKIIQTFADEVQARDKEIAELKKELKRKEKKIRDLVAELKECLDMLNKAKWEAETSGGEDGVKEMAEEENERLWAELESRKNEVLALRADHKHALSEAETRIKNLQEKLDEKAKLLEGEREKHSAELEERNGRLQDQVQQVALLEAQLQALHGDVSNREGQLRSNQDLVQELKGELAVAKDQLKEKKIELDTLQDELKKKNADMQDLVNCELWARNKEVERLQEKLNSLTVERQQQVDSLNEKLESKSNEVKNLEARLGMVKSDMDVEKPNVHPLPALNSSNTVPFSGLPNGDQSKLTTHYTVIQNTGGTDVVNVSRPIHLTLADDNYASVQMLYQEMSKIRSEAQALRLERSILSDKLSDLQKLHEQVCKTSDAAKANELQERIRYVKKQLEESREENMQKDCKHEEVVCDFQAQVQTLRDELNSAKKKISKQLTEVSIRKYQDSLKKHKQEIASLRKRLADSHNACDLLRTRLEELADFLERILEMNDKGLINLSQLSSKQLASLHKTLDESRALSRSLSQSLMIGMDTADHGDEVLLSSSVSSVSSWSLHREDSLSETHDPLSASTHEALLNLPDESLVPPDDSPDPAVQALATQLNTQIDQKTKEIDAIAENVNALSEQLAERTRQVEQQAAIIGELRGHVGRLQDEVRNRELQLLASKADHEQVSIKSSLHGSWQSNNNPLATSSQSTVHAASPQATVHIRDSSSQERKCKSPSTCSDTLPPPPLHLLQDSDCEEIRTDVREMEICQASDRSSLSAVKSAYSTDAAIKAYSGHPGYFQQLVAPSERCRLDRHRSWGDSGNAAGSGIIPEQQPWVPVSPSESEAWSEPDRNVSLARIGLDACTLGSAPDRALSRSRQQRASAAITSESEGDAGYEDTTTCIANPSSLSGKTSKRRSDVAELRRVSTKLRAVEQLNDTLRAELDIYQTLSQQMMPSQLQDQQQEPRPKTSDKSVETHKGETADASVGAEEAAAGSSPSPVFTIPAPLLEEIRALRLKLEEAISNNDQLRDQLEAALTAHPQDEARFNLLNAALQSAQEEVRDVRDRLQDSQELIHEQQDQLSRLQQKLQRCETELKQCYQQLENSQEEAAATRVDLKNARHIIQEKDLSRRELETQLLEKEHIIKEYFEKISILEMNAEKYPKNDTKVKELEATLENQEVQLLQVNKERLALVSERASLRAKLASVSTQARLLKNSQQVDESADKEQTSLHSVSAIQDELQRLEKENQTLKKKVDKLSMKPDYQRDRQANTSLQTDTPYDRNKVQSVYIGQQPSYEDLHLKYKQQEEELTALRDRLGLHNTVKSSLNEQTLLVKQLTAQLESERCLTTNLQLQLDSLHSSRSRTASQGDDTVVPTTSDLASPESVTSIEFFRPSQDQSDLRTRRQASIGPLSSREKEKSQERRSSSASRKRDSIKRTNAHWREDKENLYSITTATVTSKQSRHIYNNGSSDGVLAEKSLVSQQQPDDEADGGTTSGESPDLGIGSDYHFSSLERGTRTLRTVVPHLYDLPSPVLCSEPSHSTLSAENHRLRQERDNLTGKLTSTKETLRETLDKLTKATQRKEMIEHAMCKQLSKTHDALKKAKYTLKQPNS
ncbi:hypothetical protein SK128_019803 [Halocaridina rubra]|uniref:Centrosomin N-terminal motif 1 domain-containing protein n=1 Tax=Halocaridina rubra TaxID=373956 RepID=A0AAN8ZW06_HALRR